MLKNCSMRQLCALVILADQIESNRNARCSKLWTAKDKRRQSGKSKVVKIFRFEAVLQAEQSIRQVNRVLACGCDRRESHTKTTRTDALSSPPHPAFFLMRAAACCSPSSTLSASSLDLK